MTRSPEAGVPGTVIHASGRGCTLDGRPMEEATVRLVLMNTPPDPFSTSVRVPVGSQGEWSATLTVPGNAPPTHSYHLRFLCSASDMITAGTELPFHVLAPADPLAPPAPAIDAAPGLVR